MSSDFTCASIYRLGEDFQPRNSQYLSLSFNIQLTCFLNFRCESRTAIDRSNGPSLILLQNIMSINGVEEQNYFYSLPQWGYSSPIDIGTYPWRQGSRPRGACHLRALGVPTPCNWPPKLAINTLTNKFCIKRAQKLICELELFR